MFDWARLITIGVVCGLGALVVFGCSRKKITPIQSLGQEKIAAKASVTEQVFNRRNAIDKAEVLFKRCPHTQTGIDLVHVFPANAPSALLSDQCSGAGVCIGDFDGDDLPDVFVTNYDRGNRLYRNLGELRFEDVTIAANVGRERGWCAGASFVDADNDADLDLSVCVFDGPNLLYMNQGDGTFKEEAALRGLAYTGASVMTTYADYDRDGDLDAYLVTHRMNGLSESPLPISTNDAFRRGILERTSAGVRVTAPYRELFRLMDQGEGRVQLVIAGQADRLYQNDGEGNFRDVTDVAGISGFDIGLAAAWWDYDNDGFIDLYVSNDYKGADCLYRNNGDGSFTNVVEEALPHVPWFSMGNATGDVNNDGRVDLFASDMSGTTHARQKMTMGDMQKDAWFLKVSRPQQYMRNSLYLNTGTSRLFELAQMAGISNSDWTWSPIFGDLDNDGWVDLFVANGMSRDFMDSDLAGKIKDKHGSEWRFMPVRKERNLVFRNTGDLNFDEVGESWGLNELTASYGAALADLDRDGDLDMVVANFSDPVHVYENRSDSNAVTIRLRGASNNHFGVGAKLELQTSVGTQTRVVNPSQGFMSAGEPRLHFGLGNQEAAGPLTITWPDGRRQTVQSVAAGRTYTIEEDTSSSLPMDKPPMTPMFAKKDRVMVTRHVETPFDDFARQPLLPAKMSQQGPGIAVADVNGDGIDDLFLSGASGQAGQLLLSGNGDWKTTLLEDGREAEQLGAVFFDWDSDGDRDLYVVSGGVECSPGESVLQDRLYENDGDGNLQPATGVLPVFADSGSCVAAADYDRDGDVDLFVGGRVIPGEYPLSPVSRLLRNDRDKFSFANDVMAAVNNGNEENAKSLPGRVTSAVWADSNDDGWIDLFVTQHWGPVRCFRNERGKLVETTSESGIGDLSGWWNGIASGDVDNDGDIDFVVTNQGLNTKYHASSERPALMYFGDFDGSGRRRIVEAEFEDDRLFPGRGRSCSTSAIPTLGERFNSFRSFATATLEEVYSPTRLDEAVRFAATTFETGVLFNDGMGRFRFQPLPRLAQASPSYGVAVQDVDGDGNADIYLVQNSFSPQLETGRMDGAMSLLLLGDGLGSFSVVEPALSGLIVAGDAKSLATTDLNSDGWPDFVIGVNDDSLACFENSVSNRAGAFTRIVLNGDVNNIDAIGARVRIEFDDGSVKVQERTAGGSYLSQASPCLLVGQRQRRIGAVDVRWPDGEVTRYTTRLARQMIELTHPSNE